MTKTLRALTGRLTAATLLCLVASPAFAELGLNMTEGVSSYSREVYWLHMLIFWICVAIGIVVFGAMFVAMIKHRKSRGHEPAKFTHNAKLEAVWTTIPFLILVAMAIPATKTLIAMERTGGFEMTVKVTGYQWKWGYDYVDKNISFISKLDADSNRVRQLGSGGDPYSVDHYLLNVDKPLVLPVDTKIRFLITSGDVIHSWWVPAFGWKRDAIPGYVNEAWTRIDRPGTYRGQCAELCGRGHAFMPIVIKAVSKDEFKQWVADQGGQEEAQGGGQQAVAQAEGSQAQNQEPSSASTGQAAGGPEEGQSGAGQSEDEASGEGADEGHQAAPGGDSEWTMEEAMERGKTVYTQQCAACHQPNGQGMPPAFPSLVDSQIVHGPVDGHLDRVVNGKPGTAMQPFGKMLPPEDIAAVVTYERNAWGIDSGDLVKPTDVKAKLGQ